jgi:hypothetical protein
LTLVVSSSSPAGANPSQDNDLSITVPDGGVLDPASAVLASTAMAASTWSSLSGDRIAGERIGSCAYAAGDGPVCGHPTHRPAS